MKRIIIVILLSLISICSFSQTYFNMNNNKNFSIGVGFSIVRPDYHTVMIANGNKIITNEPYDIYTPGFSYGQTIENVLNISIDLSFYGFYFSLSCGSSLNTGASGSAKVDTHMSEGRCNVLHFGYKSPITKWLYLYPIIGHVKMTTGYCDGTDYYINEHGIHNHYTVENVWADGFDYGGGIDFKIGNWFLISGKFTKYTYGITFSFVYNFNRL